MINGNSNNHLYQQIRDDIKTLIESGEIKPGEKIGTEKELADKYSVSRPTIRQALQELEKLDMIERLLGKGTFVKIEEEDPEIQAGNGDGRTIAVVVPVISTLFMADIITGAQEIIDRTGYSMKLYITNNSVEKEKEYLHKICQEGAAGVIFHPTRAEYYNNAVFKLLESPIPLIMTGRYYRHIKCNYVVADNYDGAYQATRYLIEQGHREIGLVSKRLLIKTSLEDRVNGYKDCLSHNGIVIREGMILSELEMQENLYHISQGADRLELEEILRKFLNQFPGMTAVIALNDSLGTEVILTAKKMGRQVPEDLAVIGFDNVSLSTRVEPQLTSVDWSRVNIGRTAARELIRLIDGKASEPLQIKLPVSLIKRESV